MKKTLKRIFYYAAHYPKNLILSIIFALTGVAGSLVVPILTGYSIDFIVVALSKVAQVNDKNITLFFTGVLNLDNKAIIYLKNVYINLK